MQRPFPDPVAVIDIGSNSARLMIYQRENAGQVRILGSARQSLGLVREVDRHRHLSSEAIEATLATLAEFRSIIRAHGVRHTIAVATAAMRDAGNGNDLIERARGQLGLRIEVIDSDKEAYYGCVGGIRGLPVENGMAFDLGGGSVQVVEFHQRQPGVRCSLPLGSLRLSEAFLRHDPPSKRDVQALRTHVQQKLVEACLRPITSGGVMVGIGGTIRNLAKVDARLHAFPIARIHGYTLTRDSLDRIIDLLCRRPIKSARRIAGLGRDRADSIIGGALAIQALVEAAGAGEIIVSGQGVREGIIYSSADDRLPSADAVRKGALTGLARRFATWNEEWALRRGAIASKLMESLVPRAHADIRTALEEAAFLLDIGRSVDFFDRFKHAASMVINTELYGFSHRNILLLSAIIANAHDDEAGLPMSPDVLKGIAPDDVKRAAVLLRIADDILQHWATPVPTAFECHVSRDEVQLVAQGFDGWVLHGIRSRFERLFDRRLILRPAALGTFQSQRSDAV